MQIDMHVPQNLLGSFDELCISSLVVFSTRITMGVYDPFFWILIHYGQWGQGYTTNQTFKDYKTLLCGALASLSLHSEIVF